jgi:thiol:disulfide interchange protein
VRLDILDSFHINAHDVSEAETPLVATTVSFSGAATGITVDYPPGELRRFAFSERPLRVYFGSIQVLVKFPLPARSDASLQLNVTYQACNDEACLPPVTKRVLVQM